MKQLLFRENNEMFKRQISGDLKVNSILLGLQKIMLLLVSVGQPCEVWDTNRNIGQSIQPKAHNVIGKTLVKFNKIILLALRVKLALMKNFIDWG